MTWLWFIGLVKERTGRLAGTGAGIMVTVALLAALGAFLAQSTASMTRRAVAGVPVDWQVQLVSRATAQAIAGAIGKATGVSRLQTVAYADVDGFETHTGATVQTTGTGKVIGLDASYARDYPMQFRTLLGSLDGVFIAQQTAANLHATVGDVVTIHRIGLASADVRVAGIVDLPYADSMFQTVGVPAGAAPQAPPDNVLLMPIDAWHRLFDPQAAIRPDSIRVQLHVQLVHDRLPGDPQAAFAAVQGAAHNLEARIAGNAIVADNLAARLDAVRTDALYAKVLFFFLGAPGALLAAFLTMAVVASGAGRRRRDQALLRIRGASRAQMMKLVAVEAACVGIGGTIAGLFLATLLSRMLHGVGIFDASAIGWITVAILAGMLLAPAAILAAAWIDARQTTVATARMTIGHDRGRLWQRIGLDFIFIALSALIFWRTWSTGYQVVLAPEGTPSSSVDYPAFLAPVLLWLGLGLLTVRLCLVGLSRGRERLARWLNPIAGSLAGVVAASISRQRKRMTQGIVLIALAFAFATSTAVFNTTYNAQTRVDAELTNGADVTVTGTSQTPASTKLRELAALPGVSAAQPMQHRLAYVGTDLQDLYGIDATHIGDATRMSDAYFEGGNANRTLELLARTPDGILVSEETVKDFQLRVGDELNLRLQNAQDHQYHVVRFHFIGVVREFPTAPRDSFLVANAHYVARQTQADAAEVVLLATSTSPTLVASSARAVVAALPGVKVTDLGQAQHVIGSSLTAVDLGGLTRLELGFAVLLVAGATGLVLALGLADRRRTFAILSALGAKPRQLGAFLWSEAFVLFVGGTSIGILSGFAVAWMLVKLLTGVFDPPPEVLNVPWLYLAALVGVAFVSVVFAVMGAQLETRIPAVQRMREI
ncbi:FtsX-like permease family protein [Paraburkholderia fungorum]|uniref:FtsX-like permease family protein n=1 Tax=Paraburkholderia fungorum TaxID=134537 RepID=UPI002092229A|nr:FtsX-like permease family protein [Paraburkholderia fungorum]USU18541.1 ABC transporter permease [Paraburkholderia fungorum]USU26396.1 ABC transporter permease [Paraburkholderia fungorum]